MSDFSCSQILSLIDYTKKDPTIQKKEKKYKTLYLF